MSLVFVIPLTVRKLTCWIGFLLFVSVLSVFGQSNPEPTWDSPESEENDENAEKRPTLSINPPERQSLELEFPALTDEEIQIIQKPRPVTGPLPVAIHRTVPDEFVGNLSARLHWHNVEGKQFAYLTIRSFEAKTIRLELLLRMPKGASLRFFHIDNEGEVRVGEKITTAEIERLEEDSHWTTLVGTDHLGIELQIPQDQDSGAVFIELKNLSHGYSLILEDSSTSVLKCTNHIQVPCAIDDGNTTQATADSVLRIRFESDGSGYVCTATLISDANQSRPYLLTAAHCLSTQSEASSVSPLWFHQASSCGSTTVDSRVTASLSGSTLIAASFEDDASLALLNNPPPSQANYATWDSTHTVSTGTILNGIHHPGGYDKKFWEGPASSSGNITICDSDQTNCFLIVDGFALNINTGATEAGSSGSPVLLAGSNTIVGVYSGSDGECENNTGFAGKFSNFYPLVEHALDPEIPVDDHGNDLVNASPISLNSSTQGSIEVAGDQDWFSLDIPDLGTLDVFTSGTTNTVGRILDSSGSVLAENTGTNGVNFDLSITVFPGIHYIEVSAVGDSVGNYQLNTEFEESDDEFLVDDHGNDRDTATEVTVGQNVLGYIETSDDIDYFRFELSDASRLIAYTSGSLDTVGQLLDEEGEVLLDDDDSGNVGNFRIESELKAGTFFLTVSAIANAIGPYVLHVEIPISGETPGGGNGGDHSDTRDKATVVQIGSETKGTIDPASDVDFFQVELPEPGSLTVYTLGSTDTFGRLSSADGTINLRDDDDGYNFNFRIDAETHADTYFIEVTSYQDNIGEYVLHVEFEPHVLDLTSVTLSASSTRVEEHDRSSVVITVSIEETARRDEEITLLLGGTALHRVDYGLSVSSVTIPLGRTQGSTTLTPYRDWIVEGDETVEFRIRGNEPEQAPLTVEIQDLLDDKQPPYQTFTGSDLTVLSQLQGGTETLDVVAVIYNLGSKTSMSADLELALRPYSPEPSYEVVQNRTQIPVLEAYDGSFRYVFEIELSDLEPSSSYTGHLRITSPEDHPELNDENNTVSFGIALDAEHQLRTKCAASVESSDLMDDPLASFQWHLQNSGRFLLNDVSISPGIDLNMEMSRETGFTGKGTKVAIVDTGVEICHPDLETNVEVARSINFRAANGSTNWYAAAESDPFNPDSSGDHGTSIAGIVAAVENNGHGGRGVAPDVQVSAYNYLQAQSLPNLIRSTSARDGPGSADDVVNLSYSGIAPSSFDEDLYSIFGAGTRRGRDGLGTVFIKAAGNSFAQCNTLRHAIHDEIGCRSANSDALNNVPFLIVTGAIDAHGHHASYSSSGSNLWISAPSGSRGENPVGLVTTDQFGPDRGYGTVTNDLLWTREAQPSSRNYTSTFSGTGAAAAQITGTAAILLDVEPNLTFRDIKHILATTARKIHTDIPEIKVVIGDTPLVLQHGWVMNSAGYSFHNLFGFGLVDVDGAVAMASDLETDGLGSFIVSKWIDDELSQHPVPIPDHDGSGTSLALTVESTIPIEVCDDEQTEHHCTPNSEFSKVESLTRFQEKFSESEFQIETLIVRLDIDHSRLSDLGVYLTSPSGTESILNPVLNNAYAPGTEGQEHIHFLSNGFYGENPVGDWTLKVVDVIESETGEIRSANLRFYLGQH